MMQRALSAWIPIVVALTLTLCCGPSPSSGAGASSAKEPRATAPRPVPEIVGVAGQLRFSSNQHTRVFVDGRFIGFASPEESAVWYGSEGSHEVVATAEEFFDLVGKVEAKAGKLREYRLTFDRDSEKSNSLRSESLPIGARRRGVLGEGDPISPAQPKKKHYVDRFEIKGQAGDSRILSVSTPHVVLRVLKGDAEVSRKIKAPNATPGRIFVEVDFDEDGTLAVEVVAKRSGKETPYVLHHGRGLPPITEHFNSRFRRRRWPPPELESEGQARRRMALQEQIKQRAGN